MNIRALVGRRLTAIERERMSATELAELNVANANLRRFGWGPYRAILSDRHGTSHDVAFTSYNEPAVQGVAHTIRTLVGITKANHGMSVTGVRQFIKDRDTLERYDAALARFGNYGIGVLMVGNLDVFLDLDLRDDYASRWPGGILRHGPRDFHD